MKQRIVLYVFIAILLFTRSAVSADQFSDFAYKRGPLENVASEQPEADWWPMYQHDTAHTGHSTSKVTDTNETLWISNISPTASVGTAPAVAEKRVVVGTSTTVYCFNSSSGLLLWQYRKALDPSTSPSISEGRVFIGTGREEILCLNLTNGNLIWNFTAEGWIRESSPIVAEGRLYVGSTWDFYMYCLNATSGLLLWKYATGHGTASPTIWENRVLVPSWDGKLYCLDAITGSQIWNYTLNPSSLEQYASASYVEGKVYIGIGTKYEVNKFLCLNCSTGEVLWSYEVEGWILATPAIANGKVIIGNRPLHSSSFLYCLNASTGSLVWKVVTLEAAEYSSPVVSDGKIVLSMGRGLYVFNETNGEIIWNYNPSGGYRSKGFFGACVAISEGNIYVASQEGKLYCFGPMLYYDIAVNPLFYDNWGEPLILSPSSWTILFPNGTEKVAKASETYNGPMGTYSIVNVTWKGHEVLRKTVSTFLDSNITWNPQIDCLLPALVTIFLSSSTSYLGFKVNVTGNLTCNSIGMSQTPILLSYSVTGGETWNDIMLVNADSDGVYSATWIPSATGNYIVKAEWEGNLTFPATTTEINLAVTSFEEQSVFSVTSNSTMTNLSFNSTSKELTFTVTGPTGTTGIAKVYIPESLVANIADVKVYLNNEQIDYTATSLDDSWLLHFTYLHSTHEVTISLGDISTPFFETPFGVATILVCVIAAAIVFFIAYRKRANHKDVDMLQTITKCVHL